jgi:hypothetical protein
VLVVVEAYPVSLPLVGTPSALQAKEVLEIPATTGLAVAVIVAAAVVVESPLLRCVAQALSVPGWWN